MDQVEIPCEEEQSPLHIKRELDINIPYRVAFPSYMVQQSKDTPKTAIRTTNIEHLEPEEQEIPTENTPKTQIDVSSPRVPFLTHSQIMGMNQEDDDMVYSKSGLNNPLSEIPEEQTPSRSVKDSQFPTQIKSQDFNLDNMSMVNSQQMKFSKKSSDKDSVISRLELENSRLKEELREQIRVLDIKLKELEKENFVLKKKCNQEKVKQIELQLETEYKITTINEQYQDLEEYYKKQIMQLKNELNAAKVQINMFKDQQQITQSQIQFTTQSQYSQVKQPYNLSLSQSFTEQSQKNVRDIQQDNVLTKVISIVRLLDLQMDVKQKDVFDLLNWLFHKIKSITSLEEEEKMDEHRSLISSLKTELGEIKQIRGQLSKIYIDYDQFVNRKNEDNQKDLKINELNLTIQIMKQEKLELLEMQQKQQSQMQQKEQIINELQQKLNNLSQTDTLRKSSQFVRSLQTNSMVDLKVIKESLKQRQEVIKKTFKSQNSPQSRSHNPSPTLKFLNSPKNSNHTSAAQQKQQQQENKNYFNRTSEFSVDNSSHHATGNNNNSSHQNNEIIQKIVEQFRGNSAFAQKISNYQKKA